MLVSQAADAGTGHITAQDTVCVVGSSHSATLVLMNLLGMENGPTVVNLYRSALRYAREGPTGATTYEYTGLKVCSAKTSMPSYAQ